jgi:chromosome segregation protein
MQAVRAGGERLEELRSRRSGLESANQTLSNRQRANEVEVAELGLKMTSLTDHIERELGSTTTSVLSATCPVLPEGIVASLHANNLAAKLQSLGPINPLALEELSALEERHRDLDEQVSDVRTARRDLQQVIAELDAEIVATFASAVADVNEHFSTLVAMLFPGGTGRLVLSDPDDLLNTGVEIEVRPMGRNVRRVSLLSGGERSMAALAFSFAIFRSRPSPFYLMDEVEAALDDVNLHRFLGLIEEFRDEAQLIIVSHQKRTMETGDALYGVTMKPGGSSQVVSQKVIRKATAQESADHPQE